MAFLACLLVTGASVNFSLRGAILLYIWIDWLNDIVLLDVLLTH